MDEAVASLREGIDLGVDPWDAPIDFILDRFERDAISCLRRECSIMERTSPRIADLPTLLAEYIFEPLGSNESARSKIESISEVLTQMDNANELSRSAKNALQVLFGVKRVRQAIANQDTPEAALQACILFASSLRSEIVEMSEEALEGLHLQNIRKKGGEESGRARSEAAAQRNSEIEMHAEKLLAEGKDPREIPGIIAIVRGCSGRHVRNILQNSVSFQKGKIAESN